MEEELLLAQFSTKLNKLLIKFREYMDTKNTIIYKNIFTSKKWKMLSSFQEQSQKFHKMKIGVLTKINILPFLHEAATFSEKSYGNF